MLKDTKSLGNNKAPACESRGFVHKKRGVHFDTPPFFSKPAVFFTSGPYISVPLLFGIGFPIAADFGGFGKSPKLLRSIRSC